MKLKSLAATFALTVGLTGGMAQAETVVKLGTVAPMSSPWGQ